MGAGIISVGPVEIVVGRAFRIIPGNVDIIITVSEPDYVPGMIAAASEVEEEQTL